MDSRFFQIYGRSSKNNGQLPNKKNSQLDQYGRIGKLKINGTYIMELNRQNPQILGDEIRVAKEFADIYGPELLDRLLRVVESGQNISPTPQPPINAQTNDILSAVEKAGFKINPWLAELILDSDVEIVRNAMAVIAAYRRRGMTIRNPEGMLVEAIRNQWRPNISA